jgi:hypothetical protein
LNPTLRERLITFLKPFYQDLDGTSHLDEVERIGTIARQVHGGDDRDLELMVLFHILGSWLEKVGNISRTTLAVGDVTEADLRRTAAAIRRLDAPITDVEKSLAAAILIDRSGVRGLAQRIAAGRREGHSLLDVVREALADSRMPEWVPAPARPWLESRLEARRTVCREILDELALADQPDRVLT